MPISPDATCCVPNCTSKPYNTHFHSFPKDENRRTIWINNIGNENIKTLSLAGLRYKFICQLHFERRYINEKHCKLLKKDAVPTILYSQSDHSDAESLSLDDRPSDGESESASPTHDDAEKFDQVEVKESMLSGTADTTAGNTEDIDIKDEEYLVLETADTTEGNTEDIDIKDEEYLVLETVEGVNQPLIASAAEEYESMCMEIIGELPEDPPPLQNAPVATKVDTRTQSSQPISLQMSAVEALKGKEPRRTVPPTWRPPDDVSDKEHIAAAVIATDHPHGHIAESTEVLLHDHLCRLLDDAAQNTDCTVNLPQFRGWSYRDGIFQVRCADSKSRDWLVQAVSLMPGEILSVVSVHVPAKLVRASIWVSGDVSPVTEIKQRLDYYAAHQGIDTTGWRIFQHTSKQKPRGTLLILGMPPEDAVRVKEKERWIMYRLEALRVNFTDQESQVREDGPNSSLANKVPQR